MRGNGGKGGKSKRRSKREAGGIMRRSEDNTIGGQLSWLVSHVFLKSSSSTKCKITKELSSCVSHMLWMPDSPPDGQLCSKLDESTRTKMTDLVKKLIKNEVGLPEDTGLLKDFQDELIDIFIKQRTLLTLPFDEDTFNEMVNDMNDLLDQILDEAPEGNDETFYKGVKTHLNSISDETVEKITKMVTRIQGKLS